MFASSRISYHLIHSNMSKYAFLTIEIYMKIILIVRFCKLSREWLWRSIPLGIIDITSRYFNCTNVNWIIINESIIFWHAIDKFLLLSWIDLRNPPPRQKSFKECQIRFTGSSNVARLHHFSFVNFAVLNHCSFAFARSV